MANHGSRGVADTETSARTSSVLRAVSPATVFVTAWAFANILHLLNQTRGDLHPVSWGNLAVAIWVLGRPSSAHRLAALAAAQILDTVWLLPFTPDHQILAAAVNLAILAAYLTGRRPDSSDHLLERFAPGARALLLVAYAAAATAKYNTDFLDTSTSCAVRLANAASFDLLERSNPMAVAFVVLVIGSETLIPVLLLVPRTRRWGVLYAAVFHFLLSFSPAVSVADFTITLWALYALFLPEADATAVGQRVVARWRALPIVQAYDGVPRMLLGAVLLAAVAGASWVADGLTVQVLVWLVSTFVGAGILLTVFGVLRQGPAAPRAFGRPGGVAMVLTAALLLVAASPYLGLGTSSRFTMFSGLRTEGPGSNHLFLPSTHVVDSQNQLLYVLEANGESPKLQAAAEVEAAVTLVEINRILQDDDVAATFRTADGETIVVVAGDHSPLRGTTSWWEARTQHYRLVKIAGVTDPDVCFN